MDISSSVVLCVAPSAFAADDATEKNIVTDSVEW